MIVLYAVCAACGGLALWQMKRTRHFFRSLCLSAVTGAGALVGLSFLPVGVAVNYFTLSFCAVGGIPAVACLLLVGSI